METFVQSLKRKYRERLILIPENQYPPCHGDKLVKLELVQGEKGKCYAANWQRGKEKESIKRRPIECAKLFETDKALAVRRVLVEGDAGIGKTTLSIVVTIEWADGKLFGQFKLVLLLPLQDKRVAKAVSLCDLLKLFHGSSDICSSVAKSLEETEGENVLIVADGWDELSDSNRQPESFLYNLLFGNVLSFVSILLTSRPSASSSLHKGALINRYIEVVGFNKENISEYIQSEFHDDPEKAVSLLQQLKTNPLIASVCSIPLNCAIVCHLHRTLKQSLPHTMTELYTMIILQTLYRNITKQPQYSDILSLSSFESLPDELRSSWHCLCEFAYQAIEKDQLVFSEEDLLTIFPQGTASTKLNKLLCFGLVQSAHSVLSTEAGYGLSFHFIHLTFQECLAALHLVRQSPDIQLAICQQYGNSTRFEMIWIFFFGIGFNNQLITSSRVNLPIKMQRFLMDFIQVNWSHTSLRLLSHCCFEANRNDITAFVSQATGDRLALFEYGIRTPHDCSAVIHLLSNLQYCPHLCISFNGCRLGDRGVVPLANVLAKKSQQVQVKQFRLTGNDLTDHGISTLFSVESMCSALTTLSLSDNRIGEKGVQCIMKALSVKYPKNLAVLDLSHNPLGVFGLQALEEAVLAGILTCLEYLLIAETLSCDPDVNGAALTTFLRLVSVQCPRLRWLNLSKNHLGVPGAHALGNALSQSDHHTLAGEQLNLSKTMLSDEGITALTQSLERPCLFTTITLSGNEIHHCGVLALSECITSAVLNVRHLILDNNPLGLQGTLAICRMLSSTQCCVEYLSMANCCLALSTTTNSNFLSHSDIAKLIQQVPLNKSVQYLNVSWNNFTSENCLVLSSLMMLCSRLLDLECNECCLTSDDIKGLLTQLSNHPCKELSSWYLGDNEIGDEGIEVLIDKLSTLLPNINDVFLTATTGSSYNMTEKFEDAIMQQKMENLKRKRLRDVVLSGLCQDKRNNFKGLIFSGPEFETSLGPFELMKSLLILVYIEALYALSPPYPHHSPNITLIVVNGEDSQNITNMTLPLLTHVFSPGLRVVRGRDWDSVDDEDGGEGHVGTVVEIPLSDGQRSALVQWDCGKSGLYHCGVEGKYDLRVFDSAPTKIAFRDVECDSCSLHPLFGMMWKCSECRDYDLCSQCYHQGMAVLQDSLEHQFVRYDRTCTMSCNLRVKVPPRADARRQEAKGIFPGAVVVRGPDWNHGDDDDGGEGGTGVVVKVTSWVARKESQWLMSQTYQTSVGAVEVLWDATNKKTMCSLGYEGKVDVKCIIPASGGYYYPDHLPMLGAPYNIQQEQADKVKDGQVAHLVQTPHKYLTANDEHETPCLSSSGSRQDQGIVMETREVTDCGALCVENLKIVQTALWDVRSEWYNVGIQLDISISSLDAIRRNHHHVVEDCFTTMLKEWLERVHPPPTWVALVEALRSPPVNYPQLADKLKKKYISM